MVKRWKPTITLLPRRRLLHSNAEASCTPVACPQTAQLSRRHVSSAAAALLVLQIARQARADKEDFADEQAPLVLPDTTITERVYIDVGKCHSSFIADMGTHLLSGKSRAHH